MTVTESQAGRRVGRHRASEIDRHIGRRIRTRRLCLGMSQTGLAAKLGLSFQQVQKYERGENRVSGGRVFEMAEALDVAVTFFYDDLPNGRRPAELPQRDRQLLELFRTFNALLPSQRRAVLRIVTSLRTAESVSGLTADP